MLRFIEKPLCGKFRLFFAIFSRNILQEKLRARQIYLTQRWYHETSMSEKSSNNRRRLSGIVYLAKLAVVTIYLMRKSIHDNHQSHVSTRKTPITPYSSQDLGSGADRNTRRSYFHFILCPQLLSCLMKEQTERDLQLFTLIIRKR